jgi:hypothetical protein
MTAALFRQDYWVSTCEMIAGSEGVYGDVSEKSLIQSADSSAYKAVSACLLFKEGAAIWITRQSARRKAAILISVQPFKLVLAALLVDSILPLHSSDPLRLR